MDRECTNVQISVIIPVYNMEKYLIRCIESIENQTQKNIEIIFIDDGSTDNTFSILQEYEKKYNNILIMQQQHTAAGVARNKGIRKAKGKYVAFMDADDFYPDKEILQKLFEISEEKDALICGGSFSSLVEGREIKSFSGYREGLSFEKEGWINYVNYQFAYGFTRFLYNRKMLVDNKIYFPCYIRMEDPVFFVKAMLCAQKFYVITDITYSAVIVDKKIAYEDEKILKGIVNGFIDIMQMSIQNELKLLYSRMINEFFEKYEPRVVANFIKKKNMDEEIENINQVIDLGHQKWKDVFYKKISFLSEQDEEVAKYYEQMEQFNEQIKECKNIVIYGAGVFGKEIYDYISERLNNVNIEFAVTRLGDENSIARGKKIYQIEKINDIISKTVIIAVNATGEQEKIMIKLKQMGVHNIIFANYRALKLFI